MEKIALITDSASNIMKDIVDKYNIKVLPFKIIYDHKEYSDNINITPQEVYASIKESMPTSSLPSVKDIDGMFTKLKSEGYTHAIFVTISSALSGFRNAVELVSQNHPEIVTHVYDSHSISFGEIIPIEEAGKMIEMGKSFKEIVRELPKVSERLQIFFVVGTLEYLKRGGRIGKVAGTVAELLNLKPIIYIDKDGVYKTHDKVRGRKQSINRIIEIGKEKVKDKKCVVCIAHGDAEEEALKVVETFKQMPNVVDVKFGGFISPVAGLHSGPGLIGVGFYEVE